MKKLFWSTFAMSLILTTSIGLAQTEAVDDFLGLEDELMPEIVGEQDFTTPELHDEGSLKVLPENVVKDLERPNKGQKYSIIPWSTLDPIEWLSIDSWLMEQKIKDSTPDWKIKLRQNALNELAGKVLHCHGECEVYRGLNKANVEYLSRIEEGDEIHTGKDSVAWIYLMDGSLMRLSPETSVSVNEINIGPSEIFILARLNHGHVYWNARGKKEFTFEFLPETDSVVLPLMVRDANQEFFERKLYQSQNDTERLKEVMTLDENAVLMQFKTLNDVFNSNNSELKHTTKLMFVTPNSTLVSEGVSFDYVYLPGGKGYFKKRDEGPSQRLSLHLRGYVDPEVKTISDSKWFEIHPNGKSVSELYDVPAPLQIAELLTMRIKTIELAREVWFKKFTLPVLASTKDAKTLAKKHGYSLWDNKLEKRFDFLVEYTRRIETTNLRSLENLLVKLEKNGEDVRKDLSSELYQASLNDYLLGLKSRYNSAKMKVRESNDLQYYVWILKNGKW